MYVCMYIYRNDYMYQTKTTRQRNWFLEPWHIKFPSIHMAPPAAAKGSKAGISTSGVEVKNIPVTKPTRRIPTLDWIKMLCGIARRDC